MLTFKDYITGLEKALHAIDANTVDAFVAALLAAHENDKVVYICGNGGSAATASHMVNDLVKAPAESAGCRPFRAFSLCDCVSLNTALSNDVSSDQVFSRQLEAYGREGDVLVAISCSGNSGNVLQAAKTARGRGMKVLGMTGFDGGKLADLCDVRVHVPNRCFGQVEDAHMVLEHAMVEMLKEALGGTSSAGTAEAPSG